MQGGGPSQLTAALVTAKAFERPGFEVFQRKAERALEVAEPIVRVRKRPEILEEPVPSGALDQLVRQEEREAIQQLSARRKMARLPSARHACQAPETWRRAFSR